MPSAFIATSRSATAISTLPSTLAHVAIALTNQLFWDVPWSDGRMAPIRVIVPEGTAATEFYRNDLLDEALS